MAKIKYSDLVSGMSGKLNGSVHARNRYGDYTRNKVTPVNPQTQAQVAQRAKLSTYSKMWRTLTEEQRNAWNGAVDNYKSTNIWGDSIRYSGNILFNKININVSIAGGSMLSLPPMPIGVASPQTVSVTADVTNSDFDVVFTPTPIPANTVAVVEATPQLSPGISNANNQFRQIAVVASAGASPLDLHTEYTEKFGTLVAGMKIMVRIKFINSTTGEVSQNLKAVTIVTA